MVTAILPSLTDESDTLADSPPGTPKSSSQARNPRDSVALSVESQLTITPERFARSQSSHSMDGTVVKEDGGSGKPSVLAGLVGLFTGCGALVALTLFLPLPSQFSKVEGATMAEAVADSFYVVGIVSLLVAVFVYVGLKGLEGEKGKGWRMLLGRQQRDPASEESSTGNAPNEVRVK